MRRFSRSMVALSVPWAISVFSPSVWATNVYWDTNGSVAGANTAGNTANGTWNAATTANWTTDAAGLLATVNYATANGSSPATADVFFSAGVTATGTSTITIANAVVANSVTVQEGAIATATSGTPSLTLGGGGLNIAAISSAASTFNSATAVVLSASQAWTNNSIWQFSSAGSITSNTTAALTLSSPGVGGMSLTGVIGNGTGTTSLVVNSAGARVSLTGINTYTGSTTLAAGVLNIQSTTSGDTALGVSGSIIFSGGTLRYGNANSAGVDYSTRFSTADGQLYSIDTAFQSLTYAGNLTSNNGALTKLGYGVLALSGTNSYTGGTVLSGGVLSLGSASAIGSSGTISFNGGTLRSTATNTTDYSSRFSTAAGQSISLDPNAQTMTISAASTFNGTGSSLTFTTNQGTTGGTVNLSTNLGANFGSLNLNSIGSINMTLNVNGTSNAYAGGTNVLGGVMNVNAASTLGADSAGNVITISNHGILTLNASTNIGASQIVTFGGALPTGLNGAFINGAVPVLDLRYVAALPTRSGSTGPGVIAISNIANYNSAISLQANEYLGARTNSTYTATSLTSADSTYRVGGGSQTLTISQANVLTGSGKNLIVGVTPLANRLALTNGTGVVGLQLAQDYTGTTLVNVGSQLDLGSTAASILGTSGITVKGTLSMSNGSATGTVNRLPDAVGITLQGGTLTMNSGSAATASEDVGQLTLDSLTATLTMTTAAGKAVVINADGITRNNNSALLVRSTAGLGATGTNNVARVTLDSTSGLTQVGTTTANGIGSTTNLKVVPWIMAANSATSNGTSFATYDTTSGLRPLAAAEMVTFGAASADSNVFEDYGSNEFASTTGKTTNSIVLSSSFSGTLPTRSTTFVTGSGVLTSTSGGLAMITTASIDLQGFSAFTLGSAAAPEAVVYAAGGTLTLEAPLNAGTNYGLTKTGPGTVSLTAANNFTGAITVNAGLLTIGAASTQSSISVYGGTVNLTAANALGSGSVTVYGGGTLAFGNTVNTNFGAGTVNLKDGSAVTMSNSSSVTVTTGTWNVEGTVRIAADSGTGSRTQTTSGISMANNSTISFRGTNQGNTLVVPTLTINGTANLEYYQGQGGNRTNIGVVSEAVANSNLVISNFTPLNGSIAITGLSTYTGKTQIKMGQLTVTSTGRLGSGDVELSSSGILQLDNATAIDDLADVTIANGGLMNLNFTGLEVVGTLTLGNTTYTSGFFNSATNPTFFTGGGVIFVPEPTSLSLLALGGVFAMKRRRRLS